MSAHTYPEKCEVCGAKATRWSNLGGKVWRAWCSNPCKAKALAPKSSVAVNIAHLKAARS